jgi:hypothetical protein
VFAIRQAGGNSILLSSPRNGEPIQSVRNFYNPPLEARVKQSQLLAIASFISLAPRVLTVGFKLMATCSASFTLLDAPLSLAQLAGHLATRKNFLIYPCRERALRAIQMVAGPYGYEVVFDPDMELVALQYRHSTEPCLCDAPAAHLRASQMIRITPR